MVFALTPYKFARRVASARRNALPECAGCPFPMLRDRDKLCLTLRGGMEIIAFQWRLMGPPLRTASVLKHQNRARPVCSNASKTHVVAGRVERARARMNTLASQRRLTRAQLRSVKEQGCQRAKVLVDRPRRKRKASVAIFSFGQRRWTTHVSSSTTLRLQFLMVCDAQIAGS